MPSRLILVAAVFAILATLLVACTDPDASDSYNSSILKFWEVVIPIILTAAGAAWASWVAAKRGAKSGVSAPSEKVDAQQEELLQKTDMQTAEVVHRVVGAAKVAAAEVAEVAARATAAEVAAQVKDDGRRDRRHDDPKDGGMVG